MTNVEILSSIWIFAAVVSFFAYFIRTITGFGHSMIMAPALLLFLDPLTVIIINLVLALIGSILLLPLAIKNRKIEKVIPLILGALVGVPVGSYLINFISPSLLKMIIGSMCIIMVIPLITKVHIKINNEKLFSPFFGFLAGVSNSATSLGGPPAAIYMHNQNWPKDVIHSCLTFLFTFQITWSLVTFLLIGLIDLDKLIISISLIPFVISGFLLGIWLFSKINTRLFRIISIILVIVSGLLGIISGILDS